MEFTTEAPGALLEIVGNMASQGKGRGNTSGEKYDLVHLGDFSTG